MSNSGKTMINDLTHGSVTRQLLVFAYPFALSNILQLVYNLIDMMVIGKFVGSNGLSAVSVGGDVLNLVTHLCLGFTAAGQVMIAQYVGRGEKQSVSRTIGTMFSSVFIAAVAVSLLGILACDFILRMMNTPPAALEQAKDYCIVCFAGTVFIYGYNTVSAILRGMGDSKRPLIFIAAAAFVNLILDLIFVAGLKMDALGAALATVIGQAASFIGSLIYLYIKREAFGFDFEPASFKIRGEVFRPMLRLGLPMALQHTAISVSMLTVSSFANSFGVVASAVTGVGAKLMSSMSAFTNALNAAAASMIGQNVGAGKIDRVKRTVKTTTWAAYAAFVLIAAVFLIFPEGVFRMFSNDPEVIAWAPKYMITCVIAIFTFAAMTPYLAVVNGIGNAGFSLFVGLLDGIVARIGLAYLFGIVMGHGVLGLWYGKALAGFFTAIPTALYYFSGRWQHRKLIIGDKDKE